MEHGITDKISKHVFYTMCYITVPIYIERWPYLKIIGIYDKLKMAEEIDIPDRYKIARKLILCVVNLFNNTEELINTISPHILDNCKIYKDSINDLNILKKLIFSFLHVIIMNTYTDYHAEHKNYSIWAKSELLKQSFFKDTLENIIPNHLYKGPNYYYMKLYKTPIYFMNTDVTTEYYNYFQNHLKEPIIGHPLASNGWYYESIKASEEMGIFD